MANKLSKLIGKLNYFPGPVRRFLITKAFSSKVKFAGTTGIRIEKLNCDEAIIRLKNRRKVQNHIGGIHAVAAAVLAESATGIVFGMNVTDNSLPLLKSMHIDYLRRMQGDLLAQAVISDQQKTLIKSENKGNIVVEVKITDETTEQPIVCQMEWAWVEKRKQ